MQKPTVVDLFSGCGGFGLGAELAGFHSVAAIDIESKLLSSYRLNFPSTNTVTADISKLDANSWKSLLPDLAIDGVIGGPPCQGFSRIGKSDPKDPRRTLLFHFFRTVNILQPTFFLMENVEGLLDENNRPLLDAGIDKLDKGYELLPPIVVDASVMGAPTRRRRVFLYGYNPQKVDPLTCEDFRIERPLVNVKQAIADVSVTVSKCRGGDYGWAKYRVGHSKYAKKMRSTSCDLVIPHAFCEALSKRRFSGAFETVHTQDVIERFASTLPGETEPVSRYPRLSWDGQCPTLRAGTGSDRGNFQAVRPIHPEEPRVITVREAARLQGFPDWFQFHPTKHHSFRMIGNSVSPVVAEEVLSVIKQRLVKAA